MSLPVSGSNSQGTFIVTILTSVLSNCVERVGSKAYPRSRRKGGRLIGRVRVGRGDEGPPFMGGGGSAGVSEPSSGWGISCCNIGGPSYQIEPGKTLKIVEKLGSEPSLF